MWLEKEDEEGHTYFVDLVSEEPRDPDLPCACSPLTRCPATAAFVCSVWELARARAGAVPFVTC